MWEEVTIWTYIGLAFMAIVDIAMALCVVWMFTL